MTRSDYLSNAGKLLLICSGFLFVVNLLSFLGGYVDVFVNISSKLTTACFYIVLLLGFLAFNGEGIAYKHARQRKNKKVTSILKIMLFFAFLVRFIKTPVESAALSVDAASFGGALVRFGLGVFNTVSSYGFLLTIVALWYIFRDINTKKLIIPQALAFFSGMIYNVYKVFNYAITKYDFTYFGELFNNIFSNAIVMNVLCLVNFALDMVMFAFVIKFYGDNAVIEQNEKTAITKNMVTSRKIYSTDCFGLDTLEDDFFMEKPETI
jgi:hypothetical protein